MQNQVTHKYEILQETQKSFTAYIVIWDVQYCLNWWFYEKIDFD